MNEQEHKKGIINPFLAKALIAFATLNLIVFALILQLNPEDKALQYSEKMFNMALQLQKEGRGDMALKYYDKIIEKYPKSIFTDRAVFNTAEVDLRLQYQFDEAVKYYKKVIDEYPTSYLVPKAKLNIDFIQNHRDFDGKTLVLFYQASAYKRAKEYDKAIETLNMILTEYPDSNMEPVAIYWIGKIQDDFLGKTDEAYKTYRKLCQKYPGFKEAKEVYPILQQVGIEVPEMNK